MERFDTHIGYVIRESLVSGFISAMIMILAVHSIQEKNSFYSLSLFAANLNMKIFINSSMNVFVPLILLYKRGKLVSSHVSKRKQLEKMLLGFIFSIISAWAITLLMLPAARLFGEWYQVLSAHGVSAFFTTYSFLTGTSVTMLTIYFFYSAGIPRSTSDYSNDH